MLRAVALTDTGVELRALTSGSGTVRIAFSRLLTVALVADPSVVGCATATSDGNSLVAVPRPGRYLLHANARALGNQCPSDSPPPEQPGAHA